MDHLITDMFIFFFFSLIGSVLILRFGNLIPSHFFPRVSGLRSAILTFVRSKCSKLGPHWPPFTSWNDVTTFVRIRDWHSLGIKFFVRKWANLDCAWALLATPTFFWTVWLICERIWTKLPIWPPQTRISKLLFPKIQSHSSRYFFIL